MHEKACLFGVRPDSRAENAKIFVRRFVMAKGKGYLNLGLGRIITIILAIIPVTSWILGAITRFMRGHWIAGILQLVTGVGTLIFWVLDIITAVTSGDLKFFA